MRPLSTNCQVLTWLCIYPVDDENSWKKPLYLIISAISLIIITSVLLSSVVFFFDNYSIDLKVSINAIYQMAAFFGVTYMYVNAIFMRKTFTKFLGTLKKIYEKQNNEDSFHLLVDANENSERIWYYHFRFVIGGFTVSTTIICIGAMLFCILTSRPLDIRFVYLSLPWNQQTHGGYIAMSCLSVISGQVYLLYNGAFLLLFLSFYFNHRAFIKIFHSMSVKLDHSNREQSFEQTLCEMIKFHSSFKGWFYETSRAYSSVVLIQMFCCSIYLACTVFQIDSQIQHIDHYIFVLPFTTIVSVANLFVFCNFGTLTTEKYESLSCYIFESNWIGCPINLQKYLIIMIRDMQKPIQYNGFGIVPLNLPTFTTLLRRTYAWYTLFKTIAQ